MECIDIMAVLCSNEVVRYNELKRQVVGITGTMLNQSLKDMIELGIIKRTQYNEMPLRVEYTLTEAGKELSPIISQLFKWSNQHIPLKND